MKSTNLELRKISLANIGKKSLIILSIMVGSMLTSCKNNAEKQVDAVEDVQEAKEDLSNANQEIKKNAAEKVSEAEWKLYKAEANKKITENETLISEMQAKLKKSGNKIDDSYRKNIEDLDQKNKNLKSKISAYENDQTDWSTFKREFDSDMEGIGKAFKDLTVKNKK